MVIYNGRSFKSIEVMRLQKRLDSMPLSPLNPRQRKLRDRIAKRLYEKAKKSGDVSSIDLSGGTV